MFTKIEITHRTWLYLGLITAFLLRIFNLNYEGLWNDELFTAFSANPSTSLGYTINFVGGDVHPPLHNILSKYWAENFGYTDTSLRMLNVILGVIGVLSVYHVAKLLISKRVAIIALWLAVVNSFLIEYSQEVRAYILLFVLANYSYYFFIKFIRSPKDSKSLLYYIIITAAALYTHYFALFIMVSQGVTLLFVMDYGKLKKLFGRYILLFAGPLVLFVPWMPYFFRHMQQPFVWIQKAEWSMIFSFPQAFFNDLLLGTLVVLLLLLLLVYFLTRRIKTIKVLENAFKEHYNALLILVLWILIYFGVPFARSFISTSNMNDRYFIAIICPLLIVVAYFISLFRHRKIQNTAILLVLMYSLLTIALNTQPYKDNKGMYRDIVAEATEIEATTPILYLTARTRNFDYYLKQAKFRQLRRRVVDFDKFIEENQPEEYVVFIDLHHKIYQLDKVLDEDKLTYSGYELIQMKEKKNINNIKTARMLHYKKSKDSL
ncbi:glycosyltransferase family 39 protein [Rasiella sp. SM2506]|uniref:glycosyltransferase family 39 protein n=1 Tax=Rasiella sp. SM2506 TaxID=3423914 RepID=UPI003D7AAAE0